MGKYQREKGKRGEREAAKELSRLPGIPVTRSQQFKGTQNQRIWPASMVFISK